MNEQPNGFNLITHPWIRVTYQDNRTELVGFRTLFEDYRQINDICEEAKTRHTLYLLLSAICFEACWNKLGRCPLKEDLEAREDHEILMDWVLEYLGSPEAKEAFKDEQEFLKVEWPEWLEKEEEKAKPNGTLPETIKGDFANIAGYGGRKEEELLKNFLTLQCFYPSGPDFGSERASGYALAILLGKNIGESLWLNLRFLTLDGTSEAGSSQSQEEAKALGRAAWKDPAWENRIESQVGNLTPFFLFLKRTGKEWQVAPFKKWLVQKGKVVEKKKGASGYNKWKYPDRLNHREKGEPQYSKISDQNRWWWQYLVPCIKEIQERTFTENTKERRLSVRICAFTRDGTNPQTTAKTVEQCYHFGGSDMENEEQLKALEIGRKILKILDHLQAYRELKWLAATNLENAMEERWTLLRGKVANSEAWKKAVRSAATKILNELPAQTKEEFRAIKETTRKIRELCKPKENEETH